MKKIFALFVLTLCFSWAAQSQTTQSGGQTTQGTEVKTIIADPATVSTTNDEQAPTKAKCNSGGTKSCCSKDGKTTASAGSKSCCSDSKKSDAHCSDKNNKADVPDSQKNKKRSKTIAK